MDVTVSRSAWEAAYALPEPTALSDDLWTVESGGALYLVGLVDGQPTCDCAHFVYRNEPCKHVARVLQAVLGTDEMPTDEDTC